MCLRIHREGLGMACASYDYPTTRQHATTHAFMWRFQLFPFLIACLYVGNKSIL